MARAALTYLAEPGDPALGALLEVCEPAEVLAAIKVGILPVTGPRLTSTDQRARRRALAGRGQPLAAPPALAARRRGPR